MARLELDVVQSGSGNAVSQAAKDAEALHQATKKLEQAQADEAAATRRVEIAQARLNEVKKTAKEGSAQLLAAEDRLASAIGKLNTAAGKTGAAMGNLDVAQKTAAKSAKAAEDAAAKSGSGFGKLAGLVGKGAAALGAVGVIDKAADALVTFGADSLKAASDAEQASGAAQAVYGKDFPKIEAAANKAALSVGLAKSEYEQMAAVTGAGLKNQGITDFADKTQQVIGLGADLAAQFGGSTADAVEAIGALMRGEADPIEKYGVSIKQSAIDAELAANGQAKLTGAAKTQAEAQARLKLLFDQTTQAQGTFARESDTDAGAQQRMNAQMADFQAKVGGFFLPALTSAKQYMVDTMSGTTGLSKVLGFLGNTIQVYVTPIVTKIQEGIALLRGHLDKATGSSANTEAMFSKVGEVLTTVASITGKFIGGSLKGLLDGLGYVIEYTGKAVDWIDRMSSKLMGIQLPAGLGTIRDVVSTIESKIASAVSWFGKLGEGSGVLGSIAALFRSDTVLAGAGTGWSRVPLVVPAPVTNVAVNVDGAALRGIIRAEIRATLPRGGDVR